MGAEGWKGKMWGDTWGPSTLLLPLLPICLDTMSCKNEKRLRFNSFWAQIAFDLFFSEIVWWKGEPQENKIHGG